MLVLSSFQWGRRITMSTPETVAVAADHHLPARPLSWAGYGMSYEEQPKHYLHISASPCKECQGPVIAGWTSARQTEIAKETEITPVGAVCLWCSARPDTTAPRDVQVYFRPAPWEWVINRSIKPGENHADLLSTELSQDADRPLRQQL